MYEQLENALHKRDKYKVKLFVDNYILTVL